VKDGLKYTAIYVDYGFAATPYTIRIVPIETPRFRHGLPIDIRRSTREDAVIAAKEVDAYIDLIVEQFKDKKC
jgi:hypothetical protein